MIGAPKAGSTALHAALTNHPQLHLSPVKEPKFFLCDGGPPPRQTGPGDAHSRQEWIWRRSHYEALFAGAPPGTLIGESTPLYLQDLRAHRRMARLVPDARLIAVIRDPVDRAYSNWAHLWSDGLEPEADFLTACAAEDERQRRGWAPFWRYKGQGRYGEQLEHLFSVFPREQVHVVRYRELVDRPQATLDSICRVPRGRAGSGRHGGRRERVDVRGRHAREQGPPPDRPRRRPSRGLVPAAGVAPGVDPTPLGPQADPRRPTGPE